jgi:hypothetical protein
MEGLKQKMTYREMADHMSRNSLKTVNRVNVGTYAKRLGYRVYKPMIKGKVCHFYLNEHIESDGIQAE